MSWDWDKLKQQQESRKGNRGGIPPQVDEVFSRFRNTHLPGATVWVIALGILALFTLVSTFYTIDQKEVGVVQRFGKFARETQAGAHFKLPFGIEKVTKVPIHLVFKEEFTDKAGDGDAEYGLDTETQNEALMLTGDLNVAVVPWIVQYRVKDPYKFLFKVADVRSTLRDLSESSMRMVVGDRSINEVISKREEIAVMAREFLQKELDEAETGILVTTIELKKTNVPTPVQPSFNEVNQAVQEKEQVIYQAREEYNKAIPSARGEAERTIKAAEGYALDRVNRAKGDAARFTAQYEEYTKAPDVTRRRMYLETMGDVLPKLGSKYILDPEGQNVLPLLQLEREREPQTEK
jgi:membrane protease subunit HflK